MFRFVFYRGTKGKGEKKKRAGKMDTLYIKRMKDYLNLLVLLKPGPN